MCPTPSFETWDKPALVEFAYKADILLKQQADRLAQLGLDRKDAINAYRDLLRKTEVKHDDWK